MTNVFDSYPFDPTGVSPNNLNLGEAHTFASALTDRVLALNYGAFFSDSVVIRDAATNQPLDKATQYYFAFPMEFATTRCGNKPVCGVIVITDPQVSLNVEVDYQAVGGEFSKSSSSFVDILTAAYQKNRKSAWGALTRPAEDELENPYAINSNPRVGFEYAVEAISRLGGAIRYGDIESFKRVEQYALSVTEDLAPAARAAMNTKVNAHVQALSPHPGYLETAKLNVVLPKVKAPDNWGPLPQLVNADRVGVTLLGSTFRSLFNIPQKAAQFQISTSPTFDTILETVTTGATTAGTLTTVLAVSTKYYWRCRYQNVDYVWSDWSAPTDFTTTNV